LLILVRVPYFQGVTAAIPYVTVPLGIFITSQTVITICSRAPDLLRDIPEEQRANLSPAKPIPFVLCLLWSVANSYLRYLGEINEVVDQLEARLQRSLENKEVGELLRYQKSLVHFATGLRTTAYMLERLERSHFLKVKPPDADLLDDVVTEYREAIEMVGIASDILSQMMDSFASIIANNLNVVLKFMASITVVLMVPATIAAFYGMNVKLPLEDSPYAFAILAALSLAISLGVGLFFRKRNWL
jgi:magnesium transporter